MPKPEPQPAPGYGVPQYAAADLKGMPPERIVEAKRCGQLDRLLGVAPRDVAERLAAGEQLDRDDLAAMTPDEIVEAKAAGRLAHLLGTATPNAN